MRFRSADPRNAIVVLVAVIALGACVQRPDTGIALKKVDVDIVFAAKQTEVDAAPTNAIVPSESIAAVEAAAEEDLLDDPPNDKAFLSRLPPIRAGSGANPCPSATLADFAPEEAPVNVKGTPGEGLYRWKRAGEQQLPPPSAFKVPLAGFENRLVQKFQRINPTDFRFETVQPEIGGSTVIVTTWKVRTAGASQHVSSAAASVREPDAGLSIEKLARIDRRTGNETFTFTPAPSVLVLPLPVVPGERFQSVGIDGSNGATLQLEATVTKRQTVDACGKIVDGWQVDFTRTFGGPGSASNDTWQLIVATQLGALPIAEKLETRPDPTRGSINATWTIGQLTPSAVPAQAGS